jgi:hypothetical protein
MKIVVLLIFMFAITPVYGQRKKSKNSYSRGTLFGYFGYNRAFYSKSTIRFSGSGYDFKLSTVRAQDLPSKTVSDHFRFRQGLFPQYNARIGYYLKDHWAISIGNDHLKYASNGNQDVFISGNVTPGIDNVTNLSGSYTNAPFAIEQPNFLYNVSSLNYIKLEVIRTDQWLATRNKNLALSTNIGFGTGPLVSSSAFGFAGVNGGGNLSISGFGVSGHLSLRFEFFKHLFLQTNINAGMMQQLRVQTRSNQPESFARQSFGFIQTDAVIGFLIYIRSTNDCNSCPHW